MIENHKEVLWSDDAKDDLREIFQYLAEHESPQLAEKIVVAIASTVDRLSYQALLWHVRETIYPGARCIIVKPYLIVYDVRGDIVNVARVLHGAQDIEVIFHTEDDPRL